MVSLCGLRPQTRGRVQETVLKAKLPFSETSQVPGAAGNTGRIFFSICKKTDRLLLSTGPTVPGWLGGEIAWVFSPEMGNSTLRSCLSLLPWPLGFTLKLRCSH